MARFAPRQNPPYGTQYGKTPPETGLSPARAALVLAGALTLAGCASARVYVGAGLTAEDVTYVEINTATSAVAADSRNPMARARAGVEFDPAPRWRVSFDLSHTSSLRTGRDRGVNAASAEVRFYIK